MSKTIKQVSETLGISVHALRYYEREGLIPFLDRDSKGNRIYSENDEEWIQMIMCLREIDMPIAKLQKYLEYLQNPENTTQKRREIINEYMNFLERKINNTINCINLTAKKIEQYDPEVADILKECNVLKHFYIE